MPYSKALDAIILDHPNQVSQDDLAEAVQTWIDSLREAGNWKYQTRQKRLLLRAFIGLAIGVAKGYRFRWFTLTESNQAIEQGCHFNKQFHKLVDALRYYCPDVQYLAVEHQKPDRKDRHIITYGSDKLPVDWIRNYWKQHYLSTISGLQEIRNPKRAMYYVADYLKATRDERLVRCWTSRGWIFNRWFSFSKDYRTKWNDYPPRETMVKLALLPKLDRQRDELLLLTTKQTLDQLSQQTDTS